MATIQRARIAYTRKSAGTGDRAALSHKLQKVAIDRAWGSIPNTSWLRDTRVARQVRRPALEELGKYCRSNPQPPSNPGWICIYDLSRLLDLQNIDRELIALHEFAQELDLSNWQLRFVAAAEASAILEEAGRAFQLRADLATQADQRALLRIARRLAIRDREADERDYYELLYQVEMRRFSLKHGARGASVQDRSSGANQERSSGADA